MINLLLKCRDLPVPACDWQHLIIRENLKQSIACQQGLLLLSQKQYAGQLIDVVLQVVENSQIVFVSVKPPYVLQVLKEVSSSLSNEHVVVSIAAGIPLSQMQVSTSLTCHPAILLLWHRQRHSLQ